MLSPPIAQDLASSKSEKIIDDASYYDSDNKEYSTEEYMQRCDEEIEKTGVFEIDFSRLPYWFSWHPFDLEDYSMTREIKNNREFANMLTNLAITKYNDEHSNANLKLEKVVRANYHPSAGYTYYISFQVIDPSDGNQIKPFQAVVRYLPGDIEVYSCDPKPSSSSSSS